MGERLNPTGRIPLQNALISGDLDYVVSLGLDQVEEGAEILNMNVGLPELDEKAMMPKVIKTLQEIINVPIQLDSSNVEALEQGLRYYNGRTIVNSINGKEESLNSILPIVQKYGAAIERHPVFPQKTNVNFVQIVDDENILVKTFERGCGYTFGCGTGMTASVVISNYLGKVGESVNVTSEGGSVKIDLEDGFAYMTGPAVKICEGNLEV